MSNLFSQSDKAAVFGYTYQTINFKTYIYPLVYSRNSFPHESYSLFSSRDKQVTTIVRHCDDETSNEKDRPSLLLRSLNTSLIHLITARLWENMIDTIP